MRRFALSILLFGVFAAVSISCRTTGPSSSSVKDESGVYSFQCKDQWNQTIFVKLPNPTEADARISWGTHETDLGRSSRPAGANVAVEYKWDSVDPQGVPFSIRFKFKNDKPIVEWIAGGQVTQTIPCTPDSNGGNITSLGLTTGLEIPQNNGVFITVQAVTPGGPAANAGIRAGDLLVSINGRVLFSTQDVAQILAGGHGTANVEVSRNGQFLRFRGIRLRTPDSRM